MAARFFLLGFISGVSGGEQKQGNKKLSPKRGPEDAIVIIRICSFSVAILQRIWGRLRPNGGNGCL